MNSEEKLKKELAGLRKEKEHSGQREQEILDQLCSETMNKHLCNGVLRENEWKCNGYFAGRYSVCLNALNRTHPETADALDDSESGGGYHYNVKTYWKGYDLCFRVSDHEITLVCDGDIIDFVQDYKLPVDWKPLHKAKLHMKHLVSMYQGYHDEITDMLGKLDDVEVEDAFHELYGKEYQDFIDNFADTVVKAIRVLKEKDIHPDRLILGSMGSFRRKLEGGYFMGLHVVYIKGMEDRVESSFCHKFAPLIFG